MTPNKLAVAICTEDKKSIAQANGVGPKSAARVILELKDRFQGTSILNTNETALDKEITVISSTSNKLSDAQDALIVLGYSKAEALNALKGIDTQTNDVDDIIRLALKKLMR